MSTFATSAAMLLTPPGAAAIAVIRIRGPRVAGFLRDRFSRGASPLRCVHGELRDDSGAVIDDPVVVLHDGGDAADINLHGGPWVVASALELLRRSGFEVLEPAPAGPLPLEMVDGRTTLEREVLAHVPLAATEQGVRMLLAQPVAWRAFVSSAPGDDAVRRVLADRCLDRLLRPARVAIIGAPNVGKSTLANQLFAQERSITADLPGTTRDWVGEIANLDGLPVMLLDTPGLRHTSDPIEARAIGGSRAVIESASLVVHVTEPRAPREGPVIEPIGCPVIEVINKADLLRERGDAGGGGDAGEAGALLTVATTGEGVDRLRAAVRKQLGCADLDPARPRCWTTRQIRILERALRDPACLDQILAEPQ
jgi:tRNA modification GTPase